MESAPKAEATKLLFHMMWLTVAVAETSAAAEW